MLVRVPFTNRQLQGVVCSLEAETDLPRLRDVAELLDPAPVITGHQLRLASWISEYYSAPMSDVIGAMLPPGLGRKVRYSLEIGCKPNGHRISAEQSSVLATVRDGGRLSRDELSELLPEIDTDRAATSLIRRGLLVQTVDLTPPRTAARHERVISATDVGIAALESGDGLARAPRRREVLGLILAHGPIASSLISRTIPGAAAAIAALERRGLVRMEEREVSRSPLAGRVLTETHALPLSPAQRHAFEAIARSARAGAGGIYLLHGVTGSGKTEVYLQAVAETIATGRQAIVMVPEISLTPQAVARFAGRFPGRVAVLHSKLSSGERLDEWQRIRRGQVDVVVGPRSALLSPVPQPGLIVVDEEHDPSYKQDASPRYHARDTAAVLGRQTGATIVFGSATPDVGTYHAARSGRIHLLELPDRPVWGQEGARPMPPVEVVDMRHELKAGNRDIFSRSLREALERTLADGHQALLFLNRRGMATVVLCRDCGFVVRCPSCDIPFTYHAAATRLICHRCDRRAVSPRSCPACGSRRIRYLGIGTERVAEHTSRLFPEARVLRWDRDVTGGKEAHENILRRFAAHDADILVGTQMIAKGLDFPLVTLVGVISADTGLHLPDFRAPERSFQLITQVAGRAGRAHLPSRVVVQSYTPEHYAIQAAKSHDYHRFYREEMAFRNAALYPPLARLVRFVYASEKESACRQSAANLRSIVEKAIVAEGVAGTEIIGPAPCFVAKVKNRYFWQLIARAEVGRGSRGLHLLLDYVPPGWTVDVDPVDLL
jgi:primosomal protein N' (replication factor Y)